MLYIIPPCSSAGGSMCQRLHAQVAAEDYSHVWSVLKEVLICRALKGVLVSFSAMQNTVPIIKCTSRRNIHGASLFWLKLVKKRIQ